MKELIENVVQWGKDRGLDKVGHLAQAKYTLKETAELLDAYADGDQDKMNDAIGDILVTLIVGASNNDNVLSKVKSYLTSPYYFNDSNVSYLEISSLSGCILTMIEEKDFSYHIYTALIYKLFMVNKFINLKFNQSLSTKDCLQLAYDEIKNRKGKLVDGQFIKD